MKRSTMLLVITISIATAVTFVVLHNAEKSIMFTVASVSQVDSTGISLSLLACNPSFIPVNVEGMEADLDGISGNYGSLLISGGVIPPMSHETLPGRLDFTDFNTMKTVLNWALDHQSATDFDASVLVKEKLFGVIPYTDKKDYNMTAFSNLILGNGTPQCQIKDNRQDVRQQLTLAEVRMSVASLLYSNKMVPENETNYTKSSNITP